MNSPKLDPVQAHTLPSQVVKADEPILVAAAKSGDVSAFEALVNRYERKIFRLTQNITQNREDAEDAMQEAFLKAYEPERLRVESHIAERGAQFCGSQAIGGPSTLNREERGQSMA